MRVVEGLGMGVKVWETCWDEPRATWGPRPRAVHPCSPVVGCDPLPQQWQLCTGAT